MRQHPAHSVGIVALAMGWTAILVAGCRPAPVGVPVPGSEACEPGARYEVACGCGLGACTGDATLRVCDGSVRATDCTSSTHLAYADDSCDTLCPHLEAVCPASGAFTVVAAPYTSGSAYTCDWAVRRIGAPDAGMELDVGDPMCVPHLAECGLDARPCCDAADSCMSDRGVCDTCAEAGNACGFGIGTCCEGTSCSFGACRRPGEEGAPCTTNEQCFYNGRCEIPEGATVGACRLCASAPLSARCCDWDSSLGVCVGCTSPRYRCARDGDCCSGACSPRGECEACLREGACLADEHCCSGSCIDGTCEACAGTGRECGDTTACCDPAATCARRFPFEPGICCVARCDGRTCGDDGCGGSCGTCEGADTCNEGTGRCDPCVPNCAGSFCGGDGCGGSCGECADGQVCTGGTCCTPSSCAGRECGNDGCGGSCGSCPAGEMCRPGFVCGPNCARSGERCTGAGSVDCCAGYTCGRASGSFTVCCASFGTTCSSASQCCSGICNAGRCAACSGC